MVPLCEEYMTEVVRRIEGDSLDAQVSLLDIVVNPPETNTRTIVSPFFENEERTCIRCEFHFADGRRVVAAINKTGLNGQGINPDWVEVTEKFSLEELEKNTEGVKRERELAKQAREEATAKAREEAERQQIYEMKLQALEKVPEIRDSKNQALKKRLRKAKTLIEVVAYSTLIIQDSLSSQ